MEITEIVQLGVGIGAGTGGVGFLIRAVALSFPKLADWLRSRARKDEITAETVAEFMREMRSRLEKSEAANADCERRYADACEMIETLRAEVDELRQAIAEGSSVPPGVAPGSPVAQPVARLESVKRTASDPR